MISEKNGIHIEADEKFVADGAAGDAVSVASHAHMDHAVSGEVVASELTAKLLAERTGDRVEAASHGDVELLEAGHILGSRAALIDSGEEKILYTGDVSTRDRAYIDGFEPVDADVLIVESTYGVPAYELPPQEKIRNRIEAWLEETEAPFLFGYSLGKAQKIQWIAQQVLDKPIVAHGAVQKMNKVVEKHTDLEFNSRPYGENKDLLRSGDAVFIGPTRFSDTDAVNELVEASGGVKAGFSGWGVQESYRYRGGYDKVFPFSDHCGFQDLVGLVKGVDPDKVYTTHGFDSEFAQHLKREEGYNARALKNNQASLSEF